MLLINAPQYVDFISFFLFHIKVIVDDDVLSIEVTLLSHFLCDEVRAALLAEHRHST